MGRDLKPCPFCGNNDSEANATQSAAVILTDFRSALSIRGWRVKCIVCDIGGPAALTPTSAVELWNGRAA